MTEWKSTAVFLVFRKSYVSQRAFLIFLPVTIVFRERNDYQGRIINFWELA